MQQREARTQVEHSSVELAKNNHAETKAYKVLNISRGGLCFECVMGEFELNEILNLSLIVDEKNIHKASGRVCYCNQTDAEKDTQYGLSFLDKFIDLKKEFSHV